MIKFIDPAEKKALERTRADLERWNEKMQVEIERIQQMDIQMEFREKKLLQVNTLLYFINIIFLLFPTI
jgi:positive regulator of sigma E activity